MHHPIRNTNLSLHHAGDWQGIPVQPQRGPLVTNYLERIHFVIANAVADHTRTCVFRCDLKFPAHGFEPDTAVISRFVDSLKAQLNANAQRKERQGKRQHLCQLRYIWVKERDSSHLWHYHVALFVNRDSYFTLGACRPVANNTGRDAPFMQMNMVDRIRAAWASAMGINVQQIGGLVHLPNNPIYHLDGNDTAFDSQYAELFHRLSYFAKLDTKHYGDGTNNFGCSRN